MTVYVESAGTGTPMVLLHGFAMHGGLFAPVLPDLTPTHRVHVIDLPGHGHSPSHVPLTIRSLVSPVAAFLASLDEPATLVGWSLGGLIAQQLARELPERVGRLVLVCTSPRFVAGPGWPHAMAADTLAKFGEELAVSYRLTLQRFLTLQVQGSERGRATLATLRNSLFARPTPSKGTLAAILAILSETDLREDAREIGQPALVITGQRDALTPAAAGAWLAHAMPDARHVDIAGAAHAPFLSHREAFVSTLTAFADARAHLSGA